MFVKLVVLIKPVPKGRPIFSVARAKKGRRPRVITRTPERTEAFENELRMRAIESLGRLDYPIYPKGTPVALDFDFLFKRPGSMSRMKDPKGYDWKPGVPDIDNLQKSAMDAFKGILWADDCQVVELRSRKMYAEKSKGRKGEEAGIEVEERICIYARQATDRPHQVMCDSAYYIERTLTVSPCVEAEEESSDLPKSESEDYTFESGSILCDRIKPDEVEDLF